MADIEKNILVYLRQHGDENHQLVGVLTAQRLRGKEIFSFEYDRQWLNGPASLLLDPDLQHFRGRQFVTGEKINFGVFMDSAPDRWGRLLMRRREAEWARQENRQEQTLMESDFLLGVHDAGRMGALRFSLEPGGPFLSNLQSQTAPPWTSLRSLEQVSLLLEAGNAADSGDYSKWLNMLVDPGSSLGGARPKASVVDATNNLWIAKFPSNSDEIDVGGWEMVMHILAARCGIQVPQSKILKLSGKHHTFLSKRFDRSENGDRIHFASAMTMLGYSDGTDHNDGVSYLELAEFILTGGCQPELDIEQLWRRIVFSILTSNTDDHLRNHGFLLTSQGWKLSPAFDLNPNPYGTGLHLNISETSNSLDPALALQVAIHFRLSPQKASQILFQMQNEINQWRKIAGKLNLKPAEQAFLSPSFRK